MLAVVLENFGFIAYMGSPLPMQQSTGNCHNCHNDNKRYWSTGTLFL